MNNVIVLKLGRECDHCFNNSNTIISMRDHFLSYYGCKIVINCFVPRFKFVFQHILVLINMRTMDIHVLLLPLKSSPVLIAAINPD